MLDVLTIGTATRDVFLKSADFKVLKDPKHLSKIGFPKGEAACFALGSKIEVEDPVFTTGGGAANSAVAFSKLGLKVAASIKIGDDDSGRAIISSLKKEGVRPIVSYAKKHGTAYSTALVTKGGERTILVYRGAGGRFAERDLPTSSVQAKWLYISPGKIHPVLMKKIITSFKRKGTFIAMNPSRGYLTLYKKTLKSLLKYIDVVLVNREEASYLTGVPYHKEEKVLTSFFEIVESGIAVVTEDVKGAFACDGSYVYRVGVFPKVKMVEETGAGDAFGAGFIAGLIEKGDILYALHLASANASSVIEHVGATEGLLTQKTFQKKRWREISLDIEEI